MVVRTAEQELGAPYLLSNINNDNFLRFKIMSTKPKTTPIGWLITQLLGLVFFIGVPALVTFIAPVSWIKFTREEGGVKAEAKTCLLFIVPFRTQTIYPVVKVDHSFDRGERIKDRLGKPNKNHAREEDEAALILSGDNQEVQIPVSPADIKTVYEQATKFLESKEEFELKQFVVANWKFSVIAGGLISLLTVIYVVSLTVGVLLIPFRFLKHNPSKQS